MIVLNAGVPRSGTVLVNGLIRGALAEAGAAIAIANPHGAELAPALTAAADDAARVHVIHTHSWDEASAVIARAATDRVDLAAFACHRDPRDVCVSLMRLHDHPLEDAIDMTLAAFNLLYAMCKALDVELFAYASLVADRAGALARIANRLGVGLSPAASDRILADTGLDRQRERMARVRAGGPGLAERRNRRRTLLEDPATLINDRHIQSGAVGRWRQELTAAEQAHATHALRAVIAAYGYDAA